MSHNHQDPLKKKDSLRHGHIFYPPSRAYFAWQSGLLDEGALNQCEAGKFFPQISPGLRDEYAHDDVPNAAPPPDGKIASANQAPGHLLDEAGSHWQKNDVRSGEILDVSWLFTARHVTRRWNYFITRKGWNPDKVLSRDQFEEKPFYSVQFNQMPYWEYSEALKPPSPTTHKIPLPAREGYHVLLAVWEVADTGNAFYQVVDLNFLLSKNNSEGPQTPPEFTATNVTDKQIEFTWNAASGPNLIDFYRITRNGITTIDIDGQQRNWTDNSVEPETWYSYFICAIDAQRQISPPSKAIKVQTPPKGGKDAPPSPPTHLHSLEQTSTSISLMWGASASVTPIANYVVYRDGHEIQKLDGMQTSFNDTDLTGNTSYRYFVAALNQQDKLSVPSNVLSVSTTGENQYPEWQLGTYYIVDEVVSYQGSNWRCLQSHISYTESWAPGSENSLTLWEKVA